MSGAANSGVFVYSGSAEVSSASSTQNLIVYSGEDAFVYSGGTTTHTTVLSGGQDDVHSGGTAIDTALGSGGREYVATGGTADETTILAGAIQYAGYTTISGVRVLGGVLSGSIVSSAGEAFVSAGGSAVDTVISSYGQDDVKSGGITLSTQVGSRADEYIASGGVASFTTVLKDGSEYLGYTNVAGSAVPGGSAIGTIVEGGAVLLVSSGGTATSAVVSSGGIEIVWSGGTESASVVDSGGLAILLSGGTAAGGTISSGGYLAVKPATPIVISSIAALTQTIVSTPSSIGGFDVLSGGVVEPTGVTILSGAALAVASGFVLVSATVNSGGTVVVAGDAFLTVLSGGTLELLGGGTTSHTTGSGQFIFASGGMVSATDFNLVSSLIVASTGGTIAAEIFSEADDVAVFAGGIADADLFTSGTYVTIASGGIASGLYIGSSATEYVASGSVVSETTFGSGGGIDITFLAYSSGQATVSSSGLLSVPEGGATYTQQLAGSYTGAYLKTQADASGSGTLITFEGTPCYCRGTRLLTETGEIPVEDLRIGDRLVTHAGAARPIIWIGRRSYAGQFAAGNRDVLPVLIRAGALADCIPRRDLYVSPLHALYLDGVLVPAAALVNGTSIVQIEAVDRVEYFHLELETHDVIIAEGAAAESFVDDNSRGMFHNAGEFQMLYPDAPQGAASYCAPRVEDGEALAAIRRRLAFRIAPAPAPGTLFGGISEVGHGRICGWARDGGAPDRPVRLRILDNHRVIGEIVADQYRRNEAAEAVGSEHFSFDYVFPGGLCLSSRHLIQVQRAADGQDLPHSPCVLDARTEPVPASLSMGLIAVDRLRGWVDLVSRERIEGWAQDVAAPETPVPVQILDNGVVIARVLANRYRADLAEAGIGRGWHSFAVSIPGGLSPLSRHIIQVRCEPTGADLAAPTVIEAADSFDAALEESVSRAVAALHTAGDHDRVLSFILAQADRLRQQRADIDARRHERQASREARRAGRATRNGTPAPRALVLDEYSPSTARDGGAAAILSHMRALRRLGYEVSFVAASDLRQTGQELAADGITVCASPFYASVEEVLRRNAGCFDVVYLHRVSIAVRYLGLVRTHLPRARVIYSVADLHHVRLARQAAIQDRPELLDESRRLHQAECAAAAAADATITHSAEEAALLRQCVPAARVHVVPWAVPAGRAPVSFTRRHGVAFIGNFAHAPNLDAARFLAEDIMKLVWQQDPALTCFLVGSRMPASIRRLARPNLVATGAVTDLAEIFEQVRLTVAPLRFGAGVKAKVLASFAAGIPCVMSPVAAEGIALPPVLQADIAASAAALAARIVVLHGDAGANRRASQAGRIMVKANFEERSVADALRQAIPRHASPAPDSAARDGNSGSNGRL